MKTTIPLPLFCVVLAFLSVNISPTARAVCQEGCDTSTNTFLGEDALINNSGSRNTAVGYHAMEGANSFACVAIGYLALALNTGQLNTAVGVSAMQDNTTGANNTAVGWSAMVHNTIGLSNVAVGLNALANNTTGNNNSVLGSFSAIKNISGSDLVSIGDSAMYANTTGNRNIAIGSDALSSNTIGSNNTATGVAALALTRIGNDNTAVGLRALVRNGSGNSNIALGFQAGANLTTGSDNIDIGNPGVAGESAAIRIGTAGRQTNTYVAGISGATVPTGVAVIVDATGHLGATTSSARFKDEIKPMDKASEAILALKPVTFHYKHELDPEGIPQFGLVAEEVEKVNPDLVARDGDGKPYTVRYEAVNVMLLNEFLKARRQIDAQQKQIDALTAGLQKMSAQLEVTKPVLQTIANNQ
jgi:trimeric autotransporter adhesin